jgi:hypothetical protein
MFEKIGTGTLFTLLFMSPFFNTLRRAFVPGTARNAFLGKEQSDVPDEAILAGAAKRTHLILTGAYRKLHNELNKEDVSSSIQS